MSYKIEERGSVWVTYHLFGLLLVLVLISLSVNEFLPCTICVTGAVTLNELESYVLRNRTDRHELGSSFTSESERTQYAIQELQSEIMELLQAQRTDENDDISVKEARQKLLDERMGQERELVLMMKRNPWELTRDSTNFEHRHHLLMIDSSNKEWQLEGMKHLTQLFPQPQHFTQQLTPEEKKIETKKEQFPTQLDPALLDASHQSFRVLDASLTRSGVSWWSQQPNIDRKHVERLVSQLNQPLSAAEMQLVIRDLNEPPTDDRDRLMPWERVKFLSRSIHHQLTLEQLEELKAALPNQWLGFFEVKDYRTGKLVPQYDAQFIENWIIQHQYTSTYLDWSAEAPDLSDSSPMAIRDRRLRSEYLESLWSISETLIPQFNYIRGLLQFHVLWYQFHFFHQFNEERYRTFLSLPRQHGIHEIYNVGDEIDPSVTLSLVATLSGLLADLRQPQHGFFIYQMRQLLCVDRDGMPSIFKKLTQENDRFLLDQYLRHYYSQVEHDEIGTVWNGLIRPQTLKTAMMRTRLMHLDLGSSIMQEYESELGSDDSASLRDLAQIEFNSVADTERNKLRFQSNETVAIHFKVKNVPVVRVRIYLINTRNYYSSQQTELDGASFNLDGVSPNYESSISFTSASPYHVTPHTLELTQLSSYKRGVFIVELFGSGHRTRAVLRKGGLTAVYQVTPMGYQFQLIDIDTKKAVPGHILVGTQSYDSEHQAGDTIMLPFAGDNPESSRNHILLMSSEDSFTTLFPFRSQRVNDLYSFAATMYVDRESLLSHHTAQVLISSHLLLQNPSNEIQQQAWIELDMSRLSNIQLQITTMDISGIESTQIHRDLNLTNLEETVVPFLVPDHLSKIVFQLTCDITHPATGAKFPLHSRPYQVDVNSIQRTSEREGGYLKWKGEKKGYTFSILGRTGEPMPHRPIRLSLYHKYFTRSPSPISLQTNEQGDIHLGPLIDIREIAVQKVLSPLELSSPDIYAGHLHIRIPIPTTNDYLDGLSTYPHIISEVEGKDIQIPIFDPSFQFSPQTIILVRNVGSGRYPVYERSLTNRHVTFHSTKRVRQLHIHRLPSGHYKLWVQSSSQTEPWISYDLDIRTGIEVMPCLIYQNETSISDSTIDEVRTKFDEIQSQLQLVSVKVKPLNTSSKSLTDTVIQIQLSGVDHTTRIHLINSHFVPSHSFGSHPWVANSQPRRIQSTQPKSNYFTQVRLGDEHRYILERQVQGSRIGNMLPHPSLILFRHVTQTTSTSDPPQLQEDEQFRYDYPTRDNGHYTSRMGSFNDADTLIRSRGGSTGDEIGGNTFEFLRTPSTILTNLRPNRKTGKLDLILTHPIDQRYLQVIVVNSGGTFVQQRIQLPLPERESKQVVPQYRDLRLLSPLNASQHFVESHLITPLSHKNDSLIITNHQSSTIEFYGSLSDVWKLFRAIAKNSPTDSSLADFDFLLKWNEFSQTTKLKHYNEYGCHELNIFIWLKDQPFFQDTIRPLLTQKYHLTFIDQVLLNETDLRSFTRPNLFMKLNTVEKILLGLHLAPHYPTLSLPIFDHLMDSSSVIDLSRKSDMENYIRLFRMATQSRGLDMEGFKPIPAEPIQDHQEPIHDNQDELVRLQDM